MKRARHNGDEQDAFSRFGKLYLIWRPGQRKRIKQRANRRERREAKRGLRADYVFYDDVSDFERQIVNFCEQRYLTLTPWQHQVIRWVYQDPDQTSRIVDPDSE